ncbi:hypothetical protein RHJ63_12870 [Thermosynechococcus sp. JY1334]|uniref:hypothetical protein n=1 Tax=unclassified Thermosynechococcus TaxID=2622553 RepID=UPI002670ED4C|nr:MULTISPECIES: hypothetical protein [unclassified Thermosynechococcus]MDR5640280.1 hypothetical protein [Thermosynechococcus sp. PP42]MDR7899194.1 hypothetical protein [Thermosynechococcus sp. JY1332]MDR7906601.1 hypothetical protein [Thermosynechococcus sp. JY1334]MDR7994425.1 hypothetical protein [Thermosynechococcus sp. TG252]WKT86316.1 hypothetical protein QYC30_12890 [Thermosynechococcus sp. JY1339]
MSHSNRISKHLGLHQTHQGQIHIDYLTIPETYPKDLFSASPQLIREDLDKYKTNLIPLIIRPVTTPEGETAYEVVFGKEIVEFARELGIHQLWASRIELEDEEVLTFQERCKSILQINSKDDGSYSQKSERSNLVDQDSQSAMKLFSELQKSLNDQNKVIVNFLEKIFQELDDLKRKFSELQQDISKETKTNPNPQKQKSVRINSYKSAKNLAKSVPRLELKEAEKIIQEIKQGRKFKSIDELKAIALSGRWDEVSISFG